MAPPAGPGFAFAISGGPARFGGAVAARGSLPIGAWLETSHGAVADVRGPGCDPPSKGTR